MAAISLAVLFVAFATVLNTATFTETLASRGADDDPVTAADRFRQSTQDGMASVVAAVNEHNNTTRSELDAALADAVADWDALAASHTADSVRVSSTTLVASTDGTTIGQAAERNFTDTDGNGDWTLVEGVDRTRGFEMQVTDPSKLVTTGSVSPFRVVVEDGPATWTATVTRDPTGAVVVTVDANGTVSTCSAGPASSVELDFSSGTVGDTACPELDFQTWAGPGYDLSFVNASNGFGTYELVVDQASLSVPVQNNYGPADEGPYATPAVYAATVEVVYESTGGFYRAELRVVPGDGDA